MEMGFNRHRSLLDSAVFADWGRRSDAKMEFEEGERERESCCSRKITASLHLESSLVNKIIKL